MKNSSKELSIILIGLYSGQFLLIGTFEAVTL